MSNIQVPCKMGVKVQEDRKSTNGNIKIKRQDELYPIEEPLALSGDWHIRSDEVIFFAYLMSFDIETNTSDSFANFVLLVSSELEDDVSHLEIQLSLEQGKGLAKLSPLKRINLTLRQRRDAMNFQEILFNVLYNSSSKPTNKAQKRSEGGLNILSILKEKKHLWSWNNLYLLLPTTPTSHGKDVQTDLEGVIDWDHVRATSHAIARLHEITSCVKEHVHGHGIVCSQGNDHESSLYLARGYQISKPHDLVDKVVLTLHTQKIHNVVGVLQNTTAQSLMYGNKHGKTYEEYFASKYGELIHPKQELLRLQTQAPHARDLLAKDYTVSQTLTNVKMNQNGKNLRSNHECNDDVAVGAKYNIEMPPELCFQMGISTSIVRSAHLVPSVMHRLKWAIIASQLRTSIHLSQNIHVLRILEALTTCRCQQSFNLEALEFLGDSFLKYALSCILFLEPTKHNDGALSYKRTLRNSNTKLSWLAKKKGLASYIQDSQFDAKRWVAPGMLDKNQIEHKSVPDENQSIVDINQSNVVGMFGKSQRKYRHLESKTLADVLEALIGAYLVEGGKKEAMEFMVWAEIIESAEFDPLQVSCARTCPSLMEVGCDYGVNLQCLEKIIGYTFHNKGLLLEAITHSSCLVNKIDGINSYQRLEFLGDAALDFLVSQHLFEAYPGLTPGLLTKLRSASVNNERFARIAVTHKLHTFLRCNKSNDLHRSITTFTKSFEMVGATQEMDSSRIAFGMDGLKAPKQLADLIESIAGAVLVDSGFDTQVVWDVLKPLLLPIATPETLVVHPISELQELCTAKGYPMNVTTINKTNISNGDIPNETEHQYAQYRYEVQLPRGVVVEGTSTNTLPKKMAQMDAAQKVLAKLEALGYRTKHCVKEMRKWKLFQQSMQVEGNNIFPHEHQLNHDGAMETVKAKC